MRVCLIVESCTRRFIEAPQFFSYRPYYHRHHHQHIECVTDAHVQAAADQPVEVHREPASASMYTWCGWRWWWLGWWYGGDDGVQRRDIEILILNSTAHIIQKYMYCECATKHELNSHLVPMAVFLCVHLLCPRHLCTAPQHRERHTQGIDLLLHL